MGIKINKIKLARADKTTNLHYLLTDIGGINKEQHKILVKVQNKTYENKDGLLKIDLKKLEEHSRLQQSIGVPLLDVVVMVFDKLKNQPVLTEVCTYDLNPETKQYELYYPLAKTSPYRINTKLFEEKESHIPLNTIEYVCENNDTLLKIARKFKISVEEIRKINTINAKSNIAKGLKLYIPKERTMKINSLEFILKNSIKNEQKDFTFGWWSNDYEGRKRVEKNDNFRSYLGNTIYFQIQVNENIPTGTKIDFKLYDYDTAIGFDALNPDDYELDGKEIVITAEVIEFEGTKRITIPLFLDEKWRQELLDDRGFLRDSHLDFYWRWEYNNTLWNSHKVLLEVYPSNKKLKISPAILNSNCALPEIYSHKGDLLVFAMEKAPEGKIQKFVELKIRSTTEFNLLEDVQKFKKEIYTETINLQTNTLENVSYHVEEANHFFKIDKNIKKIYVDEKITKIPVAKGSEIAFYNSIKKRFNFGKNATKIFDQLQILDEMRNMIPGLSDNGKFNLPSLSTFIGFIPGGEVLAFYNAVFEWIAKDMIADLNEIVDKEMWLQWQNVKLKGIDEVKSFVNTNWAKEEKSFKVTNIGKQGIKELLSGKFNSYDDLEYFTNSNNEEKTHLIITYYVEDKELKTEYRVVDCIIQNKPN